MSVSLSVCKCAYMRGLAVWAPTQTISLFWKCSLKSSGADRSQEQRGKWALASFLLSLRASPLQSLCQTDIQLASKTVPEACRSLEQPRQRGLDMREVVMGTEWQLTAGAKLSVISPLLLCLLSFTHTCVVNRRHAPNQTSAQVVSMGSQWSAVRYKVLKFEATTLAGAEFTVRSGLCDASCCTTLRAACHLRSAISFLSPYSRK